MASSAVKHPAVLASRKKRLGSRWWRIPSSSVRSRFTRRTATVTMSAPDASSARTIVSVSRYFPVPTMRRDWNVRPPVARGASGARSTAVVMVSPASHEVHQLDRVARGHADLGERGAAHDAAVVLDDHRARVELERLEQLEQRRARVHRARLPVHRYRD